MKSQILTLTLISLCIVSFAQWTQIPSGTTVNLKDVHFPTNSIGYAVGDSGIVLKTTNNGSTWQIVYTNPSLTFESVYFTSIDTGYASGGKLYKTTNGGIRWIEILTDTLNSIQEVYFVNNQLGFAGANGKIYKTTNAGVSWKAIYLNNAFSSIYFSSPNTGYFIGGQGLPETLYKTIDGGLTFIQITNGFQSIKETVYFINDSVGYMAGWYGGMIAKTTNGGLNWQLLDTINFPDTWDVYFSNQNTGYLTTNGGGNSTIRNTTDGGATWTTQISLASGNWWLFRKFFFINPLTAVVVGDYGTIYKTTNGGGVGIQEAQLIHSINIYPNPFSSSTTMQTDIIFKDAILTVYNSLGQQVKQIKNINDKTIIFHRDCLPIGFYFVRLTQDNKIITTDKLIITDK
jgi:photosystem II stability/assembly factor-like uncharacterized protein